MYHPPHPALGGTPIRQSIPCCVLASAPPPSVIQDHMIPGASKMPGNHYQAVNPVTACQLELP